MIKVLIAEDEMPLLRGIKIMIEKLNPEFSVVCCAHNGKAAIEYMEKEPVDVVFTDINMPLADGIEVMKFVEERYPETQKVVISGYNDFKYAQEAMRCGVKEYILKPIVQKELERILNGIHETYKERQQKKQRNMLQEVVYASKMTQGKEKIQILYFCAGPMIKEGMEESIAECKFWKDIDVEKAVKEFLPESTGVYVFEKYQANEKILLLVPSEKIDLFEFSTCFIKKMEENNVCVTAAYHQEMIEMNQIPSISCHLRKIMRKCILFAEGSVIEDEKEETREKNIEILRLCSSIRDISADKESIILKEFESLFSKRKIRQKECIYVLRILLEKTMGNSETTDEFLDEIIWNLLLYSQDVQQLFHNIRRMLDEKRQYRKPDTTEDLMRKLDIYIQEHMTEPITAASLAAEFGLVAPYLSRLFKEYSGYTLSQYIQKIRLDRAKQLLRMDGDILAKDVAEMVGYSNPLYFSKIFKKKVGIYPSEYRKENIKIS